MQSEIIFYPLRPDHKLITKQTQIILNKIQHKQYSQIKIERSFGFEIAQDYSLKLRRSIHQANTQSINLQQVRNKHKRYSLPTHLQMQQSQDQAKEFKSRSNVRQKSLELLYKNPPEKGQQATTYLRRISLKYQSKGSGRPMEMEKENSDLILQEFKQNELVQEAFKEIQYLNNQQNQQQLYEESLSSSNHYQKQNTNSKRGQDYNKEQQQFIEHNKIKKIGFPKQKPIFLPFLNAYIKEQQFLLEMKMASKAIRNIVIQMIILALQRRKNGNFYDALDILLQTELYQDINEEMMQLKSSWLMMISKIYDDIRRSFKSGKQVSRWQKQASSMKNINKRQATILIRSLSSRRAFMQKCSIKLKQSFLIEETTYLNELMNINNRQGDKPGDISVKVGNNLMVDFPQPKKYFLDEHLSNYSIIVVKKDPETNLFPLIYPELLETSISKAQYKQKISKINSYLIPSTRCFNYESSLYQHYEPIILIIFIITLVTITIMSFHHHNSTHHSNYYILTLILGILPILVFSYSVLIKNRSSHHEYHTEIHENIEKMLAQFIEQNTDDNNLQLIKIFINDDLDRIVINTPIFFDLEEGQESSLGDDNQQRQRQQSNREGSLVMRKRKDIRNTSIKITAPLSQYGNGLYEQQDCIKEQMQNEEGQNEDGDGESQFWLDLDVQIDQQQQQLGRNRCQNLGGSGDVNAESSVVGQRQPSKEGRNEKEEVQSNMSITLVQKQQITNALATIQSLIISNAFAKEHDDSEQYERQYEQREPMPKAG